MYDWQGTPWHSRNFTSKRGSVLTGSSVVGYNEVSNLIAGHLSEQERVKSSKRNLKRRAAIGWPALAVATIFMPFAAAVPETVPIITALSTVYSPVTGPTQSNRKPKG